MFWIFMMLAGGAATFTILGMYVVLVKVLTIALIAAGTAILGLAGALLWRRVLPKK